MPRGPRCCRDTPTVHTAAHREPTRDRRPSRARSPLRSPARSPRPREDVRAQNHRRRSASVRSVPGSFSRGPVVALASRPGGARLERTPGPGPATPFLGRPPAVTLFPARLIRHLDGTPHSATSRSRTVAPFPKGRVGRTHSQESCPSVALEYVQEGRRKEAITASLLNGPILVLSSRPRMRKPLSRDHSRPALVSLLVLRLQSFRCPSSIFRLRLLSFPQKSGKARNLRRRRESLASQVKHVTNRPRWMEKKWHKVAAFSGVLCHFAVFGIDPKRGSCEM